MQSLLCVPLYLTCGVCQGRGAGLGTPLTACVPPVPVWRDCLLQESSRPSLALRGQRLVNGPHSVNTDVSDEVLVRHTSED